MTSLLFFFTCDSIGEGYSWHEESNGFNRHYGSIGYDYGWNGWVNGEKIEYGFYVW